LRQWAHAGSVGLGYSDATRSAIFDAYADLGLDLPWRLYLGLLHGEPVATSGLFLGAGVAGIYWVATVPEARRQGIATSVTLAALREARVMGYRIAILHATEMGLGVYRRLGFQEYCKMSHYKCMAETSSGEMHAGPQ
jgi:ribosomal protein S18 acetylase RimI-like enzyme